MSARLHLTRNNLSIPVREKIVALLNEQLAILLDLQSQCRQAHWNVRGRSFYSYHKLFENLADLVGEHVDPTAERATALGGSANGTVRMVAARSPLPEYPPKLDNDIEHVAAVMERFAEASTLARNAVDAATEAGDAGTADLLTAISRSIDQGLWFLEAHRPE